MNQTRGDFLHSLATQDFGGLLLCQTMGWERKCEDKSLFPLQWSLLPLEGHSQWFPWRNTEGREVEGMYHLAGTWNFISPDITPAMSFEAWLGAFLMNKDWARLGEFINKGTKLLNWVIHLGNCKLSVWLKCRVWGSEKGQDKAEEKWIFTWWADLRLRKQLWIWLLITILHFSVWTQLIICNCREGTLKGRVQHIFSYSVFSENEWFGWVNDLAWIRALKYQLSNN